MIRRARAAVKLLAGRMLLAIPATIALTAAVFALAAIAPFNPLAAYLGANYVHTGQEQREQLSAQLGFEQPWPVIWGRWIGNALHGDFGPSLLAGRPVAEVLAERLPYTLLLTGTGLLLAIVLSALLALGAVRRRGGWLDQLALGIASLTQALPVFVIALLAIAGIALPLGLPTGGIAAAGMAPTAGSIALHLALPALVLAASLLPWLVLNLRASLCDALDSDAVLAARGRGATGLLRTEVLPMALLPFITVIGTRLGELVTGALLVETVFAWPGIASAVVDSAIAGDFALLAAVTACSALAVFAGNALADAAYLIADPRVNHA